MSSPGQLRIFINYRRQDTGAVADRLDARLAAAFGRNNVFRDLESIHPGDDFPDVIAEALRSSDLVLALIGDRWMSLSAKNGGRRIDDPRDFVRLEIASALSQGVPLLPVLVEDAQMPAPEDLPLNVAEMTRRNALQLRAATVDSDAERIVRAARDMGARGGRAPGRATPQELLGTWVSTGGGDALLQYDIYPDGTYESVGVIQQARPAGTLLFQVYHAGAVIVSGSSLRLLPFRSDATLKDPEFPENSYANRSRSVESTSFAWRLQRRGVEELLTLSDATGSAITYRHP